MSAEQGRPAAKRPREDDTSALNPAIFRPERIKALADTFADAQPYNHVVLEDLCVRDELVRAREELIHNVEAKFKETDLFKVRQPART
jgi:prolyl 3-hydroxylase /prolyl 3,4-dihydroxylase